jgi:hypothetical protein
MRWLRTGDFWRGGLTERAQSPRGNAPGKTASGDRGSGMYSGLHNTSLSSRLLQRFERRLGGVSIIVHHFTGMCLYFYIYVI